MHTPDPSLPARAGEPSDPSFGILSTFPPTSCGIATFSAALAAGLIASGVSVGVVRCGTSPELEDPLVSAATEDGSPERMLAAVEALNAADVAVVQHEYGLYDGPDGESLLEVMDAVEVPMIVVAHTVLTHPTAGQRRVLEGVCNRAGTTVVMTETARVRLIEGFDIDPDRVVVVPHGAATPSSDSTGPATRVPGQAPVVLTWGLLGPGKGIEWAIDAIAMLDDIRPRPRYVVAGATHPKVKERSGEAYRELLVARAAESGAAPWVTFDDTYRDLASLNELVRSVDLVVLPYDSVEQVTSGVLVDAVAAGRPVVSTAFPHAVELLATGAGIVVPQGDAAALAAAIRAVLTEPARAEAMAAEARRLAPELAWGAVARRYRALGEALLREQAGVPT